MRSLARSLSKLSGFSGMFALAVVMAVLLGALAVLQYHWVGQLSADERDRIKDHLDDSADEFVEDFNRELTRLYFWLQVGPVVRQGEAPEPDEQRYEKWFATAEHPELVATIYHVDIDDRGRITLQQFFRQQPRLEKADWPAALEPIRAALVERQQQLAAAVQAQTVPPPPRFGYLWPDISAVVVPQTRLFLGTTSSGQGVASGGGAAGGSSSASGTGSSGGTSGGPGPLTWARFASMPMPPTPAGYTIAVLNPQYLRQQLIPRLVERHFTKGPDGALHVAVTGAQGVIYATPGAAPAVFDHADVRESLWEVRFHEFPRFVTERRRDSGSAAPEKPASEKSERPASEKPAAGNTAAGNTAAGNTAAAATASPSDGPSTFLVEKRHVADPGTPGAPGAERRDLDRPSHDRPDHERPDRDRPDDRGNRAGGRGESRGDGHRDGRGDGRGNGDVMFTRTAPGPPGPERSAAQTNITVLFRNDDRGRPGGRGMMVAGAPWQVHVLHSAGSLDAAVGRARSRNLLVSFGVLLLLGASMTLVLLSSARARRLAAQQMEFVAGVSHELRTPLAVIRSAAENLADGIVDDGKQVRRYGQLIAGEGRRLTQMVEQVMTFAGLQAGRPGFDVRPMDVGPVIEEALSAVLLAAREQDAEIVSDVPPALPRILGDPSAVGRALQNLLGNALKYGGEPPRITIAARPATPRLRGRRHVEMSTSESGRLRMRSMVDRVTRQEIEVAVTDNGPGIAARDLPHIFEPFYRGADVVAKQIHGSGLGLSLVQRIMHELGGRVSVVSTPGQGSTFTLHLPVAPEAEAIPHAAPAALPADR